MNGFMKSISWVASIKKATKVDWKIPQCLTHGEGVVGFEPFVLEYVC